MAQRQPSHRRPSWAQRTSSYQTYLQKDLAAHRSTSDYGMDNFSYDEDHLGRWPLPQDLLKRLPVTLHEQVLSWQAAGAAICTALERIEKLQGEALVRGYPDKSASMHLSRANSNSTSPISPIANPPSTAGAAPHPTPPMTPSSAAPADLLVLTNAISPFCLLPSQNAIGMESPPFTPIDSHALATPSNPAEGPRAVMPDLLRLNSQLSPYSQLDLLSPASPTFDESAWDVYVNSLKAELSDIRSLALVRLKHIGRTIDITRIELPSSGEVGQSVVDDLDNWWLPMKEKVKNYEVKVRSLSLPEIEDVQAERVARGLIV